MMHCKFYNNGKVFRALIGRELWLMRIYDVEMTQWRRNLFSFLSRIIFQETSPETSKSVNVTVKKKKQIANKFPWFIPLKIVTVVMTSKRLKLCRFKGVLKDVCNHVNFKALFNNFKAPIGSHCSNQSDITKRLLQIKRN